MIRMCNIIKENNEMKLNIVDTIDYECDDIIEVMQFIINKFSIDKCVVENSVVIAGNENQKDYDCLFLGIGNSTECIFEVFVVCQFIMQTNKTIFLNFHNHPNREKAVPSEKDIDIYNRLCLFANTMHWKLVDCYIVTASEIAGISEFVD